MTYIVYTLPHILIEKDYETMNNFIQYIDREFENSKGNIKYINRRFRLL